MNRKNEMNQDDVLSEISRIRSRNTETINFIINERTTSVWSAILRWRTTAYTPPSLEDEN